MNQLIVSLKNAAKSFIGDMLILCSNRITRKKIRRILKLNDNIFLEIGAGFKKGQNEWITLDINDSCDLKWDLINGIPFPDSSISKIYSSHLFEHFSYKGILNLMNECRRVLKNNGVFSICVPNARIYLEAYHSKNSNEFLSKELPFYPPAFNNTTRIDWINYIAYMNGEHKYMFDEKNLIHILEYIGFRNVSIRNFDPEIDTLERREESIFAEAINNKQVKNFN